MGMGMASDSHSHYSREFRWWEWDWNYWSILPTIWNILKYSSFLEIGIKFAGIGIINKDLILCCDLYCIKTIFQTHQFRDVTSSPEDFETCANRRSEFCDGDRRARPQSPFPLPLPMYCGTTVRHLRFEKGQGWTQAQQSRLEICVGLYLQRS